MGCGDDSALVHLRSLSLLQSVGGMGQPEDDEDKSFEIEASDVWGWVGGAVKHPETIVETSSVEVMVRKVDSYGRHPPPGLHVRSSDAPYEVIRATSYE